MDIHCSEMGHIIIRVSGERAYLDESPAVFQDTLIERLNQRMSDAPRLPNWRFHVKEIGLELFETLFEDQPEVNRGYHWAAGEVKGSHLHLSFSGSRRYLRLPFETLFDGEEYLCLKHPLSRGVTRHLRSKSLWSQLATDVQRQVEGPRALVVASNTTNGRLPLPGVKDEAETVASLLKDHNWTVDTLLTDEASCGRVRQALEQGEYHLFHYAGHGSYVSGSPEASSLFFWEKTGGRGSVRPLTAQELSTLVRDTPLRFVYLSCCRGAVTENLAALMEDDFLGVMDGLLMGGIPAVLGFRWSVSEAGAQMLARVFYSVMLERELTPDEALLWARRRVAEKLGRDEKAWLSPMLVMPPRG
jgi:CHAT domain-containing protein